MDRQAYFRGVQRDLEWAQSWEEFLEVGKRNYIKYNVEYELPKSLHIFGNEYTCRGGSRGGGGRDPPCS